MKRIFVIILVFVLFGTFHLLAKSNDILEDRTDENGMRIVETKMEFLTASKKNFFDAYLSFFCLRAEIKPDTTNIYLVLMMSEGDFEPDKTHSIIMKDGNALSIDKGKKLLIKQKNNNIIELENSIQIEPNDCVCVTYGKFLSSDLWVVKPQYHLSQDVIQALLSDNAEKIRIEINTKFIDRDIYKFKKNFTKLYNALIEHISKPVSIYDGF